MLVVIHVKPTRPDRRRRWRHSTNVPPERDIARDYSRPGEIVRCPWLSWEFDIRTGRSWCDPQRLRVRNYAVSVEAGTTLVEGPCVAETCPVSVENDYVVVEA